MLQSLKAFISKQWGGGRGRCKNLHDDRYPSFPSWVGDMRRTLPQKSSSHLCAVCVLNAFFFFLKVPHGLILTGNERKKKRKKKKAAQGQAKPV